MSYPTYLTRAEREIRDEYERQYATWGEQNHPDGTGEHVTSFLPGSAGALTMTDLATHFKTMCEELGALGKQTWLAILLEEIFEAAEESDPAKLRYELIQSAGVILQWVETIDRREA